MRRFRFLGYYVAAVVTVIGVAIGGVSLKRSLASAGTRPASGDSQVGEQRPRIAPYARTAKNRIAKSTL
jgi:hypothetical protein